MSDRIRIADLQRLDDRLRRHALSNDESALVADALLALIEAVETARQVERATTGTVSFAYGDWPGLRAQLARFDFEAEA